jgi:uncharacterized membrane protein
MFGTGLPVGGIDNMVIGGVYSAVGYIRWRVVVPEFNLRFVHVSGMVVWLLVYLFVSFRFCSLFLFLSVRYTSVFLPCAFQFLFELV